MFCFCSLYQPNCFLTWQQNSKEPTANLISMLLSNLAKHDSLKRILTLKRDVPKQLTTSKQALDQLMDCFVRGAEGRWDKEADFDYLSYLFADVAKVSAIGGKED